LYVQKDPPSFKSGIVFNAYTSNIVVNNIQDFIHDHTINSNNNLIKLKLQLGTTTIENTYNNKSEIESTYTFSNLAEKTTFEILASISNVFTESNNIVIGLETTLADLPAIVIDAQVGITAGKEPFVELLNASTVIDMTTPFDFYVEITDFELPDITSASNFFLNNAQISKRGSNLAVGSALQIPNLMTPTLCNYWNSSSISNILAPSTTSNYYVYGLIDDHAHLVYTQDIVTFNFTYSIATLSNETYEYFVRSNDEVTLNWTTDFKSKPEDFTNIKIFNLNTPLPSSADGLNWTASNIMPGSVTDVHTLEYLGNSLVVDSDNVLFDNQAPTFELELVETRRDAFRMQISNLDDYAYSNQITPAGNIYNTYSVLYKVFKTDNSLFKEYETSNLSYDNLTVSTTTLDGLENGETYKVNCRITDPANNPRTVGFEGGKLIQTLDTVKPTLTNTGAVGTHIVNDNFVRLRGVKAYDKHNNFDVYVGLFDSNSLSINFSTLKDNSNSGAVFYTKNNTKTSTYISMDGIFTSNIDASGQVVPIEYNRDYYAYVVAEDAVGNTTNLNLGVFATITVFDGPFIGNFVLPFDEKAPINDISRYAISSIKFQEKNDNDRISTQYVGYDLSGNSNHILIETDVGVNPLNLDSVVSDTSLDLGLTNSVLFVQETPPLTQDFSYSIWVNNKNDIYNDTTLLASIIDDGLGNSNSIIESEIISINYQNVSVTLGSNITNFKYYMEVDKWANIIVSTDNGIVKLLIDGNEIIPENSTGTLSIPYYEGNLSIPSQSNILIDAPVILHHTITDIQIYYILNVGNLIINLDFEEGYVDEYTVTYKTNHFYLNGVKSPVLYLNSNITYTFLQNNSNTSPFILSQNSNGSFPVSNSDQLNIEYFNNNVSVGKNTTIYSVNCSVNNNNKVVLIADNITEFYYHSNTNTIVPTYISVAQLEPKIKNVANTTISAQPIFTIIPSYTNNTIINEYAMVFDSSKLNVLNFENLDINTNYITLSTWVKIDSKINLQENNSIISQEGVFDYGINSNGNQYLNLLSYDPIVSYINYIDSVTMNGNSVSISNLQFNQQIVVNPRYVYAIASTYEIDKKEATYLMNLYRDTGLVSFNTLTTETFINSISLNQVIDKSGIYNVDRVNNAHVYISVRDSSIISSYGFKNEFRSFTNVSFSNEIPKLFIESDDNNIISGTVFSTTSINELFVAGINSNITDIPESNISNYIIDNKALTNIVYVSNEILPTYEVYKFNNINLVNIFNNLEDSSYSLINYDITNEYIFKLVTKDVYGSINSATLLNRFDLIDNSIYTFTHVGEPGIDRYYFNKTANNNWCAELSDGQLVYTWSGKENTNTYNSIFAIIVNPMSGSKSEIFIINNTINENLVHPCVCAQDNNKFVIAYQRNNGSVYTSTIYYNICSYNGFSLVSNAYYTRGTEARDANSLIDICAIDGSRFLIVWDDYGLQSITRWVDQGRGRGYHTHDYFNYLYDVQYIIVDSGTFVVLIDHTIFESNDRNTHPHKICFPSVNVSQDNYCIVWQYYSEIYTQVRRKSDYGVVWGTTDINVTSLNTWYYNDPMPVCCESLTTNQYVYAWYDNRYFANTDNIIYVREMGTTGSVIISDKRVNPTTGETIFYNIGHPKIFINENRTGYDLFVFRRNNTDGPNYNVYRYHYKLSSSLDLIETIMYDYIVQSDFDILEFIGHPVNIVKKINGKYQESLLYTETVLTTITGNFNIQISSGELLV
jgi:hypothetical protein